MIIYVHPSGSTYLHTKSTSDGRAILTPCDEQGELGSIMGEPFEECCLIVPVSTLRAWQRYRIKERA